MVTFKDKTLLQRIHEDLINDFLIGSVKSHRKNPPNDFDKFELHDGLLYHERLLYVPESPTRFQVFKTKHTHWLLAINLNSTKPWS